MAIIAFSKGTISSRLYLKSLQQQQFDLPAPRAGFNPISEFVALSPPNHGIAAGGGFLGLNAGTLPDSLSVRQLNNGYTKDCSQSDAASLDFIKNLNNHPIQDSGQTPLGDFPDEALGFRPNGDPVGAGTLYVTIYADGNRDAVGGSTASTDCQGRLVAKNLAPGAVNVEVPGIPAVPTIDALGLLPPSLSVHRNTPHTREVICLALYTVVHHRFPEGGVRCSLNAAQLPRIPPRAAVVHVLDFSGSMLSPACATCAPKLEVLKDAVALFIDLWGVLAGPGDRIGATYFGTLVESFPVSGTSLLPLSTANLDAFRTDLLGRGTVATNLTAMGGGLQRGIEVLETPDVIAIPQRHVILFTDGMQNVNPMVVRVDTSPPPGAFRLEIAAPSPRRLDTNLGVRVHTVGVGATPQLFTLLSDIAQRTGGSSRITTAPDDALRQFFVEEVIEALQGNSPQLVDYRRATPPGASASERFRVEKGATRLVLKLSWKRPEKLGFRVERNGVDVSEAGRFVDGPFYRIFAPALPGRLAGQPIGSDGEWTMKISGRAGAAYEAAAIVDEPRVRFSLTLGRPTLSVDDPMEVRLKILVAGRPLAEASRAVATIFRPRESIGTLLALDRTSPPSKSVAEGASAVDAKVLRLLADEASWRKLQPEARTMSLENRRDGWFSGTFVDTKVPGSYRIVVTIDGRDADIGEFNRTATLTTVVRLTRLDLEASDVALTETGRDGGGRRLRLALRPRDQHGNYLGPGHAQVIRVAVTPGSVGAGPQDTLDGGYAIPLYVPLQADPLITLDVLGQVLFSGRASELGSRARFFDQWRIALIVVFVLVLALLFVWARRRSRRA